MDQPLLLGQGRCWGCQLKSRAGPQPPAWLRPCTGDLAGVRVGHRPRIFNHLFRVLPLGSNSRLGVPGGSSDTGLSLTAGILRTGESFLYVEDHRGSECSEVLLGAVEDLGVMGVEYFTPC
jgi:hypothetical protein